MQRSLALVLSPLLVAACAAPVRRPAGDELPYPPLDAEAMDRTASPCQDFYQWACGRWVAETMPPPDRAPWVKGEGELEERNLRLLRRILEDARSGKVEAQERFGRKAGDFYEACMDEADVEAHGAAELQAEWARLDAVGDREELAQALARLEAMGLPVPFGLRAATDPADPRRALLGVEARGIGLPAAFGAGPPEVDAAYLDHVRAELRLAGVPASELEATAQGAVELERALAAGRQAAPAALQRIDRAALDRRFPGFPWDALLGAVGAGPRLAVAVAEPGVAAAAGRLFQEAPLDRWKAYLRWRLTDEMAAARATQAAVTEERFRYRATLGPSPAELRPRWKYCVERTGQTFGFVAGTAFGRRHLGIAGRERAGELVSAVEAGLQIAVLRASWLDGTTRARAARKLDRLQVQVGFPDGPPDYERLRVGRDSYFRDVLSAGRYGVAVEVARAERSVDRAEWLTSPFAPAPQYLADRNALCVPAGALQPPLYDRQAPQAVRLGTEGVRLGSALAEALQGSGRDRGADGEESAWWTPLAGQRHAAAEACLATQFQAFRAQAPGTAEASLDRRGGSAGLDPEATLSDLAGLVAAWETMHARPASGVEPRLLGLAPDQQFFLAWAQSLCTARPTVGGAAHDVAVRFRVNGALANLPEFAKTFRCGEGTPMARAERCAAW